MSEKNDDRWMLLKHKCGAFFTVRISTFAEIDVGYSFRCFGCMDIISGNTLKALVETL